MRVAVPMETAPGERRARVVPETVAKLRDARFELQIERGAGAAAGFSDAEYASAGAELVDGSDLAAGATASSALRRRQRFWSPHSRPGRS